MDPTIKANWIADLRHPTKYKQGRLALCDNGKHCCLGVLLEGLNVTKRVVQNGPAYYGDDSMTVRTGGLPAEIAKKVGILANTESKLVHMNDAEGKSFTEIADWIEVNL